MHSFTLCLALLAGGQASYGPLDGLKVLKPADTQDHPSTPAPAGAVVLFDANQPRRSSTATANRRSAGRLPPRDFWR